MQKIALILAISMFLSATGCGVKVLHSMRSPWARKYCKGPQVGAYGLSFFKGRAEKKGIKALKRQARSRRCRAVYVNYKQWLPYKYQKRRMLVKGRLCKCYGVEYF